MSPRSPSTSLHLLISVSPRPPFPASPRPRISVSPHLRVPVSLRPQPPLRLCNHERVGHRLVRKPRLQPNCLAGSHSPACLSSYQDRCRVLIVCQGLLIDSIYRQDGSRAEVEAGNNQVLAWR